MLTKIQKRDGRTVPFNIEKIADAIYKAARAVGGNDYQEAGEMAEKVCDYLEANVNKTGELPTVDRQGIYPLQSRQNKGKRNEHQPYEDL